MGIKERTSAVSTSLGEYFTGVYNAYQFIARFFRSTFRGPFEFREVVNQCYNVGWRSLPLVTLTGFVTGIVFTKQSRPSLADFGATSWLPSLIAIAIVRALAPLVTALISAGKVGSNIGAELGSMKVTEQIEAMEVSAVRPFNFLVVTRVLATSFMLPMLMLYFGFVAMIGSFINVHQNELTSFTTFTQDAFESITFLDIWSAVIKSVLYGFTIGIVGCYKGFNTTQGTEGVGRAANASVVLSMFLIFIEEVFVVQITNWMR